ncbi:hypothetical protein SSX86_014513 [Deinandra increscens subsp. villosa]|uniref:Uncharacterized protein n=1 Tax=Deinandra increscens subsp. villosa TaxID=3103831 RepID=A0AAP0D644_9ASTR
MLQRQIMFKQLEELQRQKKLQELNDSRQQNVFNQQSLLQNKQASGAQYAPLINGTPVRDPSQMFMFGNTNLVHGFQNGSPYSQAQNQILHSTGLPSQPVDGHSFSRFSHFQGPTRESNSEQVDTLSGSSMSDQFNVSYQTRTDKGYSKGQEQDIINPSQEFTSLDPMEQKFLFTDDENLGGFGNMFEDNDNVQGIPSVQSGSWSALMQSALEETSSTDTGVQEEWSGLSFQNPEPSNDNQPSSLMENAKNQTLWQNNNFQSAHSLNSRPEASAQVQRFSPLQVHQGLSVPAGEYEFVNGIPNNGRDFKKGLLPDNQRQSKASEATTFRSSDSSGMSAIMDRSADFPAPDLNSQTSRHMLELLHKVDKFREYKHGSQSAYTDSPPTSEMPKAETTDAFNPSNNASTPQYFGLRLAPPTQRPPVNYFSLSQISPQADTSHLVSLKDQDSQRSSLFESQQVSNLTRQSSVWVDIPSQQTLSGVGIHKAPSGSPSTSDVANSRIVTASEAPKNSDSQMYVKGGNDLLEASRHVLNSQEEGKIPFKEESFSGRAEVNASSLKQTHSSPLNPTYSDPNTRAAVKNEKVDSDIHVPLLTSMSQLTSVYENYKNVLVPSSARESQLVKHSSHPLLQDGSQLHRNNAFVQLNLASTSQHGSVWPVTGTSSLAVNQDLLVSHSKKRKFSTQELLPWHKEATKGSPGLQDISVAELEWAQAAKRVPEKLKEESEALGNSSWMFHSKKRIILTTQLMQVLFRPAPAAILSVDATTCYDTISYFAARLALGDACSLANHSNTPCDISDSLSGKAAISKGSGDRNLSKIIENFIDRAKKLEDELLRLENGGSVLEIRMETQDLERFSMINRFAKFHSRPQMVAPDPSSSGVHKFYPQRYVIASEMPKIVPQGHNCLSL